MNKMIISACLLGEPCRYDGKSKPIEQVEALQKRYQLLPICPECMGGLPTPRPPAELQQDGRVVNCEGRDVTEQYRRGAEIAWRIARQEGCALALLKEKSPSCGCGEIYDGSFSGRLIPGDGVAAALLQKHGIAVYGETQVEKLLKEQNHAD